jgi:hypothetical protein
MRDVPFIFHVAPPRPASTNDSLVDLPTSDDPLPAALEIDGSRLLRARQTRITEVERETTDDQ